MHNNIIFELSNNSSGRPTQHSTPSQTPGNSNASSTLGGQIQSLILLINGSICIAEQEG